MRLLRVAKSSREPAALLNDAPIFISSSCAGASCYILLHTMAIEHGLLGRQNVQCNTVVGHDADMHDPALLLRFVRFHGLLD